MCKHFPLSTISIPCMNDAEGITTMPVRFPLARFPSVHQNEYAKYNT